MKRFTLIVLIVTGCLLLCLAKPGEPGFLLFLGIAFLTAAVWIDELIKKGNNEKDNNDMRPV